MTDAGNGQPLLCGQGREKGSGAAEQDPFPPVIFKSLQIVPAQDGGTASASGSAGSHLLMLCIEYKTAAVLQFSAEDHAVLPAEFQQKAASNLPQISRNDDVVVIGGALQIPEMGLQCGKSGRRHGSSHIAGIPYSQIGNGAHCAGVNDRTFPFPGEQNGTGTGNSPLCRRRALSPVSEGRAVLPFR